MNFLNAFISGICFLQGLISLADGQIKWGVINFVISVGNGLVYWGSSRFEGVSGAGEK